MMPPLTTADLDDYQALTATCGLVDVTPLCDRVELTGDDRHAFLHNFCTNDIRNLADGAGCEAFLLDAKGHVLFYVFIWRRPDRLLIETAAGRGEPLLRHLDKYLIREKVVLRNLSAEWSERVVGGPEAPQKLQTALGLEPPAVPQANAATADGIVIVRGITTTAPYFVLLGPTAAIDALGQKLIAAGVRPCGPGALETLRIETGLPRDGVDVSDKNLAQEVDRNDRTLHFRKGCYLGQETVARLDALGHVNKRLVGLTFLEADAANPPQVGTTPTVGQITSVAFSPRLKRWVALAYVRENSTAPGTRLDTPHGPAEVAALPFV